MALTCSPGAVNFLPILALSKDRFNEDLKLSISVNVRVDSLPVRDL